MRLTLDDIKRSACANRNPHLFEEKEKTKPKYGNKKVEIDGIIFDSKKEGHRYRELKLQQQAGLIKDLRWQVEFELKVNEKKICKYKADFTYTVVETNECVVEDVKSPATRKIRTYIHKKELMKAIHKIEIREV